MGTFATATTIEAPVTQVWNVLADIGSIYQWNPGVKASHATTEATSGMGACRYCDLGGRNFLDEEVVAFRPNQAITMRITNSNLPFKTADIRFTLDPDGNHTRVTVSPLYTLKYGPIGRIMDRFYVSGTYKKGMDSLLAGLKTFVEEM